MKAPPEPVRRFLDSSRIAVAGVSRDPQQAANAIYRRLAATGAAVFAVNPRAESVEGAACYPRLDAIPGGLDAVVVATPPGAAVDLVRQCVALGVRQVWFHRSFGAGSVSAEAVALCRSNGIVALVGGCPLMYLEPVDMGHRCIRWILGRTGGLPSAREG